MLPQRARDLAQGSCSRRNLRAAQRMFAALLLLTAGTCILLEGLFLPDGAPVPPRHAREKTFITVESGDGRRLGNLMFSYASLLGIAHRKNMTPAMRAGQQFPLPNFFQVSPVLTDNIENLLGMYSDYTEYGRRACAYDMGVESIPHRATRLWGYYQSWKYFEGSEELVKKQFNFLPSVRKDAENYISQEILKNRDRKDVLLIGIHVRRGDITLDYFKSYGYTTPERDYYQSAVQYMHKHFNEKGIEFIVCSDDIKWAKENLRGIDPNIHFSDGRKDFQDLAILSLCDHTIISVGSFGWWAGWLAGGTVIYYDKWPREFSKLEYHINKKHYFLPTWIPIR